MVGYAFTEKGTKEKRRIIIRSSSVKKFLKKFALRGSRTTGSSDTLAQ